MPDKIEKFLEKCDNAFKKRKKFFFHAFILFMTVGFIWAGTGSPVAQCAILFFFVFSILRFYLLEKRIHERQKNHYGKFWSSFAKAVEATSEELNSFSLQKKSLMLGYLYKLRDSRKPSLLPLSEWPSVLFFSITFRK